MSYVLTKIVLGSVPQIPIDLGRWSELVEARGALLHVIDIEESWDSVVATYLELEIELAEAAVHSTALNHEGYVQFGRRRLNFARRMSNLLHSSRAYLDQTARRTRLLPSAQAGEAFARERRSSYDRSLCYRVMEALRNHAQHYDVPLHGTSFKAERIEDAADFAQGSLQYTVAAKVDVGKLRENSAFKASVLKELAGMEALDVAELCREYVEALNSVHMALREATADPIRRWREAFQRANDDYAAVNDGNTLGLAAAQLADDGSISEIQHLGAQVLEWHDHLIRRNGSLVNLRRRYATTKLQRGKAAKGQPPG